MLTLLLWLGGGLYSALVVFIFAALGLARRADAIMAEQVIPGTVVAELQRDVTAAEREPADLVAA